HVAVVTATAVATPRSLGLTMVAVTNESGQSAPIRRWAALTLAPLGAQRRGESGRRGSLTS
ncbi:MAG: hypothetical protein M3R22_06105, partial [Pseudomonadota bacterium]|nr:hypothetical protein [Pseudomonadota bacterium]